MTTLFGFALTTGLGVWLIPSFVRWTRTRADTRKSNYYHQRIKSLYADGQLDEKDIDDLDELCKDVVNAYSRGSLNELHYGTLKNELSMEYEDYFKKRIESLKSNDTDYLENLEEINKQVKNAHSKGTIIEIHYINLKNEISALYDKIFRNKIDLLKELSDGSVSEQFRNLKESIENKYSEQMITETQFNLLNKKISALEGTNNDKLVE